MTLRSPETHAACALWPGDRWWGPRRRRAALRPLKNMPRYTPGGIDLGAWLLAFVDGPSTYFAFRAIFDEGVYDFPPPAGRAPRIIDGGANVGLAIRYWLSRFDAPRITAFEADASVFGVLKSNVEAWTPAAPEVVLHQAALWTDNTSLNFVQEGADAGHVDAAGDTPVSEGASRVSAVRLRDVLEAETGPVDLLKLDIEGAETAVVKDCQNHLGAVRRLFVEHHGYVDRPQDLHVLLQTLSDAGFRYHVQPELVGKRPFFGLPSHAGMDQRVNVFAFRP